MNTLQLNKTPFSIDKAVKENTIGRVISVGDGIARVSGLNNVRAGELVQFSQDVMEWLLFRN
jgi:F0F1-type ATP synthase alpha subunit